MPITAISSSSRLLRRGRSADCAWRGALRAEINACGVRQANSMLAGISSWCSCLSLAVRLLTINELKPNSLKSVWRLSASTATPR
nr:hypothetical protein [Xenorhabdus bovienii]